MALPTCCMACVYHKEALCRRHSPSPSEEKLAIPSWPPVLPTSRCGEGAVPGGKEKLVTCGRCIHWHLPEGKPIEPLNPQGRPPEWWAKARYCVRLAPRPSSERGRRRTQWPAMHESESCGDGKDPDDETD